MIKFSRSLIIHETWPFPNTGIRRLIAPKDNMIRLPSDPVHSRFSDTFLIRICIPTCLHTVVLYTCLPLIIRVWIVLVGSIDDTVTGAVEAS